MENSKLCPQNECTLCMACVSICPKEAIEVSVGENGYEKLEINPHKCVECGLCTKVCKRRNEVEAKEPLVSYAAQATDREKLQNSASGGAFQMIADFVLENGGVCYGAQSILSDGHYHVEHTRIENLEDLHLILNSKYVPSNASSSYKNAAADLEAGRFVLFCSTPCQIQGLMAYLNKDYPNLLTADLICHGVTSTNLFNDYLSELEQRDNITVVDYQFRDKSISWGTNFRYSYYKNEDLSKRVKVRHCPREASSYMIHYLKRNIFRENCYSCLLSAPKRVSDFTLGDYWEIESEHPEFVTKSKPSISLRRGVSCILVNTEKARDFVQNISSKMILHKVSFESVAAHNDNLLSASKRGRGRDEFLQTYREKGYSAIEERYRKKVGKKMFVYNVKNVIKSRLPDRIRILIYRTPFLRKIIFH